MEDIKKMIEKVIAKIKGDKGFASNFKSDPIKAVEGLLGVDLPDDTIKNVVDGVKAKLTGDKISSEASSLVDKVKDLF